MTKLEKVYRLMKAMSEEIVDKAKETMGEDWLEK